MGFQQEDILSSENIDSLLSTIEGLYQTGKREETPFPASAPVYPQTPVLGMEDAFAGNYTTQELEQAGFNDPQIAEIQMGLQQGLAVEHYAKLCYTWTQMREIRYGLHASIDTTIYENNLYTVDQMREIRMGLLNHVDASVYANLMLSVSDMHTIRLELAESAYRNSPKGYGYQFMDEDSGLTIRISDDCMRAYLSITRETKRRFTPPGIIKLLKYHEITHGIIMQEIENFCENAPKNIEVQVAQGSGSTPGCDGSYDYFFTRGLPEAPTIKEDGTVDYVCVKIADSVKAGQVLAVYHPSRSGENGFTVNGIPIREKAGQDLPPLKGMGFTYEEETYTYRAQYDGNVSYNEEAGSLNVWKNYTLNGDATRINGNVRYDGSILIRGDVRNMACIQVTGDIVVEGMVEGAELHAGQNIVLKKGVNAAGKGLIEAKGRIMGNFFEAANLKAGESIEGNYFLNCQIETDDLVIARGGKSLIQGGNIVAAIGIEANHFRCNPASKTSLMVGRTPGLTKQKQELAARLTATRKEIDKLKEGIFKLEQVLGPQSLSNNTLYQKTSLALKQKDAQYALMLRENERLEQILQRTVHSYIKASGMIQANILVNINGSKKLLEKNLKRITLTNENLFKEV